MILTHYHAKLEPTQISGWNTKLRIVGWLIDYYYRLLLLIITGVERIVVRVNSSIPTGQCCFTNLNQSINPIVLRLSESALGDYLHQFAMCERFHFASLFVLQAFYDQHTRASVRIADAIVRICYADPWQPNLDTNSAQWSRKSIHQIQPIITVSEPVRHTFQLRQLSELLNQ